MRRRSPADRARRFLADTRYDVNVAVADAEDGLSKHAPYDAIVVTVGAWDVPPAWIDQLTDDGRLVVPLRINGLTRTYGFRRQGNHLVADREGCARRPSARTTATSRSSPGPRQTSNSTPATGSNGG